MEAGTIADACDLFGKRSACVGSSIGPMLMLVAVGVMSITCMSVIALLVFAQKLLPAKAAIDLSLALAIVALGILTVLAPSSVPGLTPPTRDVMGGAGQASCGDDSKERSSDRSQDWNA
jgi:hypothetical protein